MVDANEHRQACVAAGSGDRRRHRFTKGQRLRKSAEFQAVFDRRLSVADALLVIYGRYHAQEPGRLGLSVSRKVGNAAVRNRWKRSIREVFRRHAAEVHGWDLVVIPRRGASPDYHAIAASLPKLILRLQRKRTRRYRGADRA